jgi:hypothetical protein
VYGREQEHVKRLVVVADEAPGLTRGKDGSSRDNRMGGEQLSRTSLKGESYRARRAAEQRVRGDACRRKQHAG